MYATLLDSNVVRGVDDTTFAALCEAEKARGIRAIMDSWTLMELLAHLADPKDKSYAFARSAVKRLLRRAPLNTASVVAPTEAQVVKLLFDEEVPAVTESLEVILTAAKVVETAGHDEPLDQIAETLRILAADVANKEQWFADHFGDLARRIKQLPHDKQLGEASPHSQTRAYLRSPESRIVDAIAIVHRAYRQTNREIPQTIALSVLSRVAEAANAGMWATATALESVLCDGANLNKDSIRNLLWDQEIAFSLGNTMNGLPVVLVTDDPIFRRAAAAGNFASAVRSKDAYLAELGIAAT